MFHPDQYQLLDFGQGRRLERFGPYVLDRPAPAVEDAPPADPGLWPRADARFERGEGKKGDWLEQTPLPERWNIEHGPLVLELKPTDFGHLGVFPEQAANWDWIAGQVRRYGERRAPVEPDGQKPEPTRASRPAEAPAGPHAPREGLKVLNLFAYTGGSTLAAAAAGAAVVHVDSARNTVAWARRNAEHSSLAEAPIRWIAEDAMKFVKRELRRGNRYDAVVLDPPSYGHGPRGEVWRLSKHLPRLLQRCVELTAERLCFMLLTCHTPGYDASRVESLVAEALGDVAAGELSSGTLGIQTADGRTMPGGIVVRWSRRP
jgi:23S rRNA (cytosine1962-C5)-methyltransferase